MKKNVLIINVFIIILISLSIACNAEWIVKEEVLDENTDVFTNGQLQGRFVDFGKEDGYITTIDNEKFYINNYKRYFGFQKIYSMDVFDFFKETFSDLFQYEKTNDGYIVCEPAYRVNMQNMGWTGGSPTVSLYDDDLNLIDSVEFPDAVYSVDYINQEYMVQFIHSADKGKNITHSYKKSKDFRNWEECESLRKVSDFDVTYENGAKVFWSEGFGPCRRMGGFYETYNMQQKKTYVSFDGIYSMEQILEGNMYCEDDSYLYCKTGKTIKKTPKQAYYDTIKGLSDAPYVKYNNTILAFDQPPVIENDYTLVPIRFLFEQMGAEVAWDQQTQTATIAQDNTIITFGIDNTNASVNGHNVSMDIPARLINNKTMAPVRFLAEELDYTVYWDGENRIITIE